MAGEANEAMDREITVNRDGKWLHIRIPLPSFKEECQFTLEPMNTVGDLCTMMKKEDNSITDCVILLKGEVRVAYRALFFVHRGKFVTFYEHYLLLIFLFV